MMPLQVPGDLIVGPDLSEVRHALSLLMEPGQTFELRALPSARSWVGNSIDEAIVEAPSLASGNLYYTLNPIKKGVNKAAKNTDIECRRWLLIDIDPNRDNPDTMATEAEKAHAFEIADRIRFDLKMRLWPDPMVVDSGNGYHLLYRIELPNSKLAQQWIASLLRRLADTFNSEGAHVDKSVHNAARIARLPGTWTRKGIASKDRPHRISGLVSIPANLEVVPVDLIKAMVGKEQSENDRPSQRNGHSSSLRVKPPDPTGHAAYFANALANAAGRVALAAVHTRHDALRAETRGLAGWLHLGHYTESELIERMRAAGLRAGLPPKEVHDAIEWAIANGKENPLPLPVKLEPVLTPSKTKAQTPPPIHASETIPADERLTIRASEIVPKVVKWLWNGRVPIDFITVFAGRTGLGKSFVLCDLAARITQGMELPDGPSGLRGECRTVLFISEDPYEYVLAPRLIELGADMEQVHFLRWEWLAVYSLADIKFLERAFLEACEPALIVIDPPTNFLGRIDEHKNAEVRSVLTLLVQWLSGRGTACVLITHVNKQTGKGIEALNRVLGSVAWTTTARVAHSFSVDPDNPERRLFVPMKNNLGPTGKGLAYRIVGTDTLAKVEWLGEVDTTADEAMAGEKKQPRKVLAHDWLIKMFSEKLEWPSGEFWKEADAHGVSKNAINEARVQLEMPSPRPITYPNGKKEWIWWVPPNWPHLPAKGATDDRASRWLVQWLVNAESYPAEQVIAEAALVNIGEAELRAAFKSSIVFFEFTRDGILRWSYREQW